MIDCAIHPAIPAVRALFPYLPELWQSYIVESGFGGPEATLYPPRSPLSAMPEALPPDDGLPGSDLALLRAQVLDRGPVTHGILCPLYAVAGLHNEDLAAALASAMNEWQREQWLEQEPRLWASLVVPAQNPELAVAEIERLGHDRRFVQVLLPLMSEAPYGKRRFWPIYAAAQRFGMPIAIVAGATPGQPPTPAGFPSYHFEEYVAGAQVCQSQVLSLVSEGVFVKFPDLRVVLVGSGCTWLPSLMWRFDKDWRGLRREVPWLVRPPSEYIRAHLRLTLQPFDAPPGAASLQQFMEHSGSEDLLLFSSAYPQCHMSAPEEPALDALPHALRQKIQVDNPRAVYRLDQAATEGL